MGVGWGRGLAGEPWREHFTPDPLRTLGARAGTRHCWGEGVDLQGTELTLAFLSYSVEQLVSRVNKNPTDE